MCKRKPQIFKQTSKTNRIGEFSSEYKHFFRESESVHAVSAAVRSGCWNKILEPHRLPLVNLVYLAFVMVRRIHKDNKHIRQVKKKKKKHFLKDKGEAG